MSQFLTKLILEDVDGESWIVHQPLAYESDLLKKTVTVPAGTVTDLASIPAAVWLLIPKTGKWDAPAVVHDVLYTSGEFVKEEADYVLYEAMSVMGVGAARKWAIYYGVHMFGWWAWRRHRKKDSK